MTTLILILRLVHLFAGIFWVGTAMFTSFFLAPALATVGPAAGSVMAALERKRLMTALPTSALAAMGSGLWLFWLDAVGTPQMYVRTHVGGAFAVGGVLAILAFLLSMTVSRPSFLAVGRLSASLAAASTSTERDALTARLNLLRERGARSSKWAVAMLLGAVFCMAVARYL